MTNRRQFIQNGFVLSAASLAVPQALRAHPSDADFAGTTVELFVFDDRYPEAVSAASTASAGNVPTASMIHFMTELWYEELDLHWKRSPMTLDGMTTGHGLFVVETLALDRNMRITSRTACETNELIRWSIGPRNMTKSA